MKYVRVKLVFSFVLSVCLYVGTTLAKAQELDPSLCGTRLAVFVNGVQNGQIQADANRLAIETVLRGSKSTKDIYVSLAYNRTAGASDFSDVFNQKKREFSQLTFKEFVLFALSGTLPSWVTQANAAAFRDSMRKGLRDAVYKVFDQYDFDTIYNQIKFNVTGLGKDQYRLMLIAHSQGNLYANAVYEKLVNRTAAPYRGEAGNAT